MCPRCVGQLHRAARFVTGFTPIIGPNGGVGGIDVDVDGVLRRIDIQSNPRVAHARKNAMKGVSLDVRRKSTIRKVSLSRLEAAMAQHAATQQTLGAEILYLAGLQRVEYVFIYPESSDIVIAGPAEGWMFRDGEVVGESNNHAVLRLDDLLDALQSTAAAVDGKGITCSIDPTEEGMAKLQRMLKNHRLPIDEASLSRIEQQLGEQNVTVTGIRPTSHFARVMVSADYMMKRIAMDLEPSPVEGLPSYMQLLQRRSRSSQLASPRWWLATNYETVQRSEDGLAWHFQGRAVQAKSEHGYLNQRGQLVSAGRPSPLAKHWADRFTSEYDALAKELPVFSQLSGCVDLAVLAALITQEGMRQKADCPLLFLTDPGKFTGENFAVPKTVLSKAGALQSRSGWIVSVSGGVDLDTASVLQKVKTDPRLSPIRRDAINRSDPWWWD